MDKQDYLQQNKTFNYDREKRVALHTIRNGPLWNSYKFGGRVGNAESSQFFFQTLIHWEDLNL